MSKQPDKPEGFLPNFQHSTNFLYWIVSLLSKTVTPAIRTSLGKHGVGLDGLMAGVLILGVASLGNSNQVLMYFFVWSACCMYRRMTYDPMQATQFPGWCLLTQWMFHGEMTARLAEAVIVWVAAGMIPGTLGVFLQWSAYGLFGKYLLDAAIFERQKEAIGDTTAMMEIRQEQMKGK